ncbi:hypothetical protein Droror1_Dr00004685 [Drosera rotundifolia]
MNLFKKEASKYDNICREIVGNLETQDNLYFANIVFFKQGNHDRMNFDATSREKIVQQIQTAIAKYQEIKEKINKSMKFYATLQVLSKLCSVIAPQMEKH